MDKSADVKLVLKNAVAPFAISRDRRGAPLVAARTCYASKVQAFSDHSRAQALAIFREDALNYCRLFTIDLSKPALQLSSIIDAICSAVAIGKPCRTAALRHRATLATFDLRPKLLPKLRIHQPFEGAVDFRDLAIRQREQPRARIVKPFSDSEAVTLVASDTVGRLGEHLINPTGRDCYQHGVQTRAVRLANSSSAADGIVRKYIYDCPAFAIRPLAANGNLVLNRPAILQSAAVACVDNGPHR